MESRRKFAAVLTVFLFAIAARTLGKPLYTDLSSLSSTEMQYYFGRSTGVPEYRLLNTNHLRRERRSTSSEESNELRYNLDAFDETFQLTLQQTKNLFHAGTLVHRIGANGTPKISSPEQHCYYSGESENHPNSRVYLSTCNGLFGTIIVDSGEYVIQPLKTEHIDGSTPNAPDHIIYKKPSLTSSASCPVHDERPAEDSTTTDRRRKRDVTDATKFIEASITVDDQMHETYGNGTENYVLSILNQVSGLFRDSNLDFNIALHINKITIVEKPQKNLGLSNDLDYSLDNFCAWQKSESSDISLLVTRRDLESAGNSEVTGKAADVGGACDPARRCLITEDHGPSGLVFTVAHEIGHSLGMYHDGGFSDCKNRKNIMASENSGGPDAFRWSECSKNDLNEFLSTEDSECLDNPPLDLPEYTASSLPMAGYYINVTRQCQLTFGQFAVASQEYVDTKLMCKALRCDLGDWGMGVTNDVPPLDGTSCGKSNRDVCMRGSCIKVYSTLDCNGGPCVPRWLEGAWEGCQANCIEQRAVLCVEIHTDDSTTRLVDESTCPADKPAETRECCTTESRYLYEIGTWGSCSVTCGTGIESRNVVCMDTQLGQTVSETLCNEVKPATQQPCILTPCTSISEFGYIIAPFGTCSVTCGTGIQSRSVSCVNSNNVVVATSNCVNAGLGSIPTTQACNTLVTCPSVTTYRFVFGTSSACSVTCGTGSQTRQVMCLSNSNAVVADQLCINQGLVRPSETVPCTLETCQIVSSFRYVTGGFEACSVTCGTGIQTRTVTCVNENNVAVEDASCTGAGLPKPSTTQPCVLDACDNTFYVFVTGNYGPCDVTCGAGVQTRSVFCVNQNSLSFPFQFCINAGLEEPQATTVCNEDSCPGTIAYSYDVGAFSECSVTCGEGIQTRSVLCMDNNGFTVADDNCVNAGLVRPADSETCFLGACASYYVGEFAACTVTCGGGNQVRVVECRDDLTNDAVADELCPGVRPSPVQECATNPCDVIYEYLEGPFGTCSCDGFQTRIVLCVARSGASVERVDTQVCIDAGLTSPDASQACTPPPSCAGPTWSTTEFSACSVTCGVGVQTRLVFCVAAPDSQDIVDEALCNVALKPEATQSCDTEVECPNQYIWLFSEWGQCSVTCGEGVETRSVRCYSLANALVTEVDPSLCPEIDEPPAVRECVLGPCNGVWQASVWSDCSAACGCGGTRDRTISCYTFKGSGILASEEECIAEDRPGDSEDCYVAECPSPYGCEQTYEVGSGTTYQLQSPNYPNNYPNDLTCNADYMAMVAVEAGQVEEGAEALPIIADAGYHIEITFTDFNLEDGLTNSCEFDYLEIIDVQGTNSVKLCGTITDLPYVYSSTGPELQITFVTDASNNGRGYSATYEVVANEGARYIAGEFGECSVTCGDGFQTRTIQCSLNEEIVDDTECAGLEQPAAMQPCNLDTCPTQDACLGEVLRTEEGSLTSPNFPNNYTNNAICVNRIRAPLGQVVAITTLFFELVDSINCANDALVVDDVNSAVTPSRFCGNIATAETIFTSLSNEVLVSFVTNGNTVDSGFSINYEFLTPTLDICNSVIQTNNQPIYSPGYGSSNYSNDAECVTTIVSPSCVELQFNFIDLFDDSCDDVITIDDTNTDVVDISICGNAGAENLPAVWRSASEVVRVTFTSNGANVADGFLGSVQFAECYVGTYVTGEWSACSTTCGEGVETRIVRCRNALTNALTDDTNCPEDKPDDTRACNLEACPSCDTAVESSGNVINYPMEGGNYGNNEDCTTTITNPSGCNSIIFLDVNIQPGTGLVCDRDYLEIIDGERKFRICGNTRPANFQSISGTLQLRFVSDDLVTSQGYSVYNSYTPCPTHAYIPGEWSECDAECDFGTRTREVPCVTLSSGEVADNEALCSGLKPAESEACILAPCPSCDTYYETDNQLVLSENFPGNYSEDLDCVYTFNNTNDAGELCILLRFLDVGLDVSEEDVEDDECETDYLEAIDLNYPPLTQRFCGDLSNTVDWVSRSSEVELRFVTDDVDGLGRGFNVYESFTQCSPFGYVAGEYAGCDVTCGGGTNTRPVTCVTLETGNPVTDTLCSDPKPSDTVECNEQECPSCDEVVGEQDIFNSPNYPMSYDNDQECQYTIYNPNGCVSLLFLEMQLENPDGDGDCRDYVEIADDTTDFLTTRYCGDQVPGLWRSRSSNVTVRFYSDDANVFEGFSLYPSFTACPMFGFVTQEFGECSVTCGDGNRLRQVNCLNLITLEVVLDGMCTDPKPTTSEPCFLDACPSCNQVVNQTGSIVDNPEFGLGFEECEYSLQSLDPEQCVRIFFINFNLPPRDEDGECSEAAILIEDELDGYSRDRAFCGMQAPFLYEALSSEAEVTFRTSNNVPSTAFSMYVSYQTCPEYSYAATEWGECSTTCGVGTQSRNVICYDTANMAEVANVNCEEDTYPPLSTERECTGEPCPICYSEINMSGELITSPGFPNDYLLNQNCIYNITNTNDNGCIRLQFLFFQLSERDNGACADYLTVDDVNDNDPEPVEFCDREAPMTWDSSSGNVVLNFVSDGTPNNFDGGFTITQTFLECPEPSPFLYEVGEYGECDVTCGEGTQMRAVICVRRDNGAGVAISLCEGALPPSTRVCSEEPCPSCDRTITEGMTSFTSPNNPLEYENNQNCVYNITNPDGGCINLIFLSFNLEAGSQDNVCDNDYLRIEDDEVDSLTRVHCGSDAVDDWRSRSSTALLTFNSNDAVVADGFNVYATFVTCPTFGYVATEWSVCDAGCGGGTQTRTVECQRLSNSQVFSEELCTDARPAVERSCNIEPCPSCDETINQDKQTLLSPDSPGSYGENYNCEYTFINPEGDCTILFFVSLDLPDRNSAGICDEDYIVVEDLSENPVSYTYCGSEIPPQFQTRSSMTRVRFVSDNFGPAYNGFSIYNSFSSCPLFGFVAGEYGMCNAVCGGGIQTRTVNCVLFSNGQVIPENTCTDQKPDETRACNTEDCPSCDETISMTEAFFSPNYPQPYFPSRTCTYTITNPDDCVRLTFLNFNVPQGPDPDMCTTDFVKIADLNVDYLNTTICGPADPGNLFTWQSQTGDVQVTLQSGPVVPEGAQFQIYASFDDCPTHGWVAGEFDACSQTCGMGTRTRTVECQTLATSLVADDSACDGEAPSETEACIDVACPSCDEDITVSDVFRSLNPYGPNRRCVYTVTNPDPSGCINLITLRMDIDEAIGGECNVSSLTFEDNGNPSLTQTLCGNMDPPPPGWMSASNSVSVLFETGPDANQTGDMGWEVFPSFIACPNYGYTTGSYGMCSASCEGGTQIRTVQCRNLDNNMDIDDAYCSGPVPPTSRACNEFACPQECGLIYTPDSNPNLNGETTVSSPGFGYGYPNNEDCTNTLLNPTGCIVLTFLDMSIQPSSTEVPCDTDYVEIQDANFPVNNKKYCGQDLPSSISWRSQSSLVRVEFISDGSITDDGFQMFYTFTDNCPTAEYVTTTFSACSVTCGGGVRVRSVTCRNTNNQVVPNTNCPGAMPDIEQVCSTNPCATYVVGEWSDCSAECGGGNQTRNVTCEIDSVAVDDAMCIDAKPEETRACNGDGCPMLTTGAFGACDATCGGGTQTRTLECYIDSVLVDISSCPDADGLNTTQDCNLLECPTFVTGEWTECAGTCGFDANFQTRNVTCENSAMIFDDAACTETKPDEMQVCNNRTCDIICGDTITVDSADTGSFSIPWNGGNYAENLNCTITFDIAADFIVTLSFTNADIAFAANLADCTNFDYIEIIGTTTTQICSDAQVVGQTSTPQGVQHSYTFSLYSNADADVGAGVEVAFTQVDTTG